jgi:hypothetical protein
MDMLQTQVLPGVKPVVMSAVGHRRCSRPRTHGHAPDSGGARSKTSSKVSSYSSCAAQGITGADPPHELMDIHTQALVYIFIYIQAERQGLTASCAPLCSWIFIAFYYLLYYWFYNRYSGGTAEFDGMEAQPAHLCAPAKVRRRGELSVFVLLYQ